MSTSGERGVFDRVREVPRLSAGRLREVRPRELAIRFAAGAATSVVAGVLGLVLGERVGGVMLAFPAILAASLTLIEQEDDGREAREDARGAIVGALGLAAFAVVAALALPGMPGWAALLLATAAWVCVAVGGYFAVWR